MANNMILLNNNSDIILTIVSPFCITFNHNYSLYTLNFQVCPTSNEHYFTLSLDNLNYRSSPISNNKLMNREEVLVYGFNSLYSQYLIYFMSMIDDKHKLILVEYSSEEDQSIVYELISSSIPKLKKYLDELNLKLSKRLVKMNPLHLKIKRLKRRNKRMNKIIKTLKVKIEKSEADSKQSIRILEDMAKEMVNRLIEIERRPPQHKKEENINREENKNALMYVTPGGDVDCSLPFMKLLFTHNNEITAILMFRVNFLIIGDSAGSISIGDIAKKKLSNELTSKKEAHTNSITIMISYDANTFISASKDNLIKIWDFKTTHLELNANLKKHESQVTSLAIIKNNTLGSGDANGIIIIWDLNRNSVLKILLDSHEKEVSELMILSSHDLISVSYDSKIKVWDIANGYSLKYLSHKTGVQITAFCEINQHIFALGSKAGKIKFWEVDSNKSIKCLGNHSKKVTKLLRMDQSTMASSSEDNSIRIWDLLSMRELKVIDNHCARVNSLAMINSNTLISGGKDLNIFEWNIENY